MAYEIAIERIELCPAAELELTEASEGMKGYRIHATLKGDAPSQALHLVLSAQIKDHPAIAVEDLGDWLLGRLHSVLRIAYDQVSPEQRAAQQKGFLADL